MTQNMRPPQDHPEDETEVTKTEARQGTGPRQMVSVLFVSVALAVAAGVLLFAYFYFTASPSQPG